jgi:hypothetical protein
LITFSEIVGGPPSSAGAITKHLLATTLAPDQKLARYYGREGGIHDPEMADLAQRVADGDLAMDEAVDIIVEREMAAIPEPTFEQQAPHMLWESDHWVYHRDLAQERDEQRFAIEGRVMGQMDAMVERIQDGTPEAPTAVLRPDMHPMVAQGLGIDPQQSLTEDQIQNLLSGHRSDGQDIENKVYAVERAMPANSKDRAKKWSQPIGSYGFTVSPHKSIAVAFALAPPPEQALLLSVMTQAGRDGMAYVADRIGWARTGKGGQGDAIKGEVAWLEFFHATSRKVAGSDVPGDPGGHIHYLIPNAVFCPGGRVGSLDTAAIGHFLKEGGAYVQARLGQLLRENGFDAHLENGVAVLSSVPNEINTLFSKRTNKGVTNAMLQARVEGLDWDALPPAERVRRTKSATQGWKQRGKGGVDDVSNPDDWRRQAKDAYGWEPSSFQLYGPPLPPLSPEHAYRKAYELALPMLDEMLREQAVLTHHDLRAVAFRGMIETGMPTALPADADVVTRMMWKEGVLQDGTPTKLGFIEEPEKRFISVTTERHVEQESEFVRLGKSAAADRRGAIPKQLLHQKIRESGLDVSDKHGRAQLKAIERAAFGGRFSVTEGASGMGKTAGLTPQVAAWREMGREVWGTSLASRQSDDLACTGIDKWRTRAFEPFMDAVKTGDIKLSRNSVVVVDEWGTLNTRQGLELLRAQAKHGFTVTAIGDSKQIDGIGAGNIFDLSRRVLGDVPVIETTKRQKSPREQEISALWRAGEAAEALSMKREDGTAIMAETREDVIAKVAELYVERLKATGKALGINAPNNRDAQDIGRAVRDERRKLGQVGPDLSVLRATDGKHDIDLPLAKGDRVRLHMSTKAMFGNRASNIGRNGSVLDVHGVTETGLLMAGASGKVGLVKWDALKHENGRIWLSYGDAMTMHTSQGSSRGDQITALPDGSQAINGKMSYSALTRHFHSAWMITSEQAERTAVQKSRPIGDRHGIDDNDLWSQVAKSFAQQPEKDNALMLIGRAGQLRMGGVSQYQTMSLRAQLSQRAGKALSMAPELAHRQRLETGIAQTIETMSRAMRQAVPHEQRGPAIKM